MSVLIATKDRPTDLEITLNLLRAQDYPNLEVIVIDDGSSSPLEMMVHGIWPQARYIRHKESIGQCVRRSEGFEIARGSFILQLDDDACPAQRDSISRAVLLAESKSRVAAIAFQIFNGDILPEILPAGDARYTHSFVGCGVLFRTASLREIGGYCSFFGNEWEEEELSLRIFKAGWAIYFLPCVVVHHRLSICNRVTDRTWMRGLRNKLWALVMHLPAPRVVIEIGWVIFVGTLDAVRLMRFKRLGQALVGFVSGLPRALHMRQPLSRVALRRLDAARLLLALTDENYDAPPRMGFSNLKRWFSAWRRRPRQRSFWDRRRGDIGECETVSFAHEYSRARQAD